MPVDEEQIRELHLQLVGVLGEQHADTLMEVLREVRSAVEWPPYSTRAATLTDVQVMERTLRSEIGLIRTEIRALERTLLASRRGRRE